LPWLCAGPREKDRVGSWIQSGREQEEGRAGRFLDEVVRRRFWVDCGSGAQPQWTQVSGDRRK
jgi:hypothetical protein